MRLSYLSYLTCTAAVLAVALPAVALPVLADEAIAKRVLKVPETGENLLRPDAWRPWQAGFEREDGLFVCDNGSDATVQRGAGQTVELNQTRPEPIVAAVWSLAEGVTGSPDNNYAVYLDLEYTDGTPLWGQAARFDVGTHDWQHRRVLVLPEKPVKRVSFYLLLRSHAGKARFRDPTLQVVRAPRGATLFDGVAVTPGGPAREGFQVRDVAAGSDFVQIDRQALGLTLDWKKTERPGATFFDVTLSDTTGADRAVTLLYAVPVAGEELQWLHDPRRSLAVQPRREYVNAGRFRTGANGQLSRYPLGAVADAERGVALGLDMARPAFFRIGYNAGTGELYLAFDLGLAPEKPQARLRFCRYEFDPAWGFRGALAGYYELFSDAFRCRTPRQGLWMPFAKISEVRGWQDFGFRFKEGNNETKWDDEHEMLTFRYTEPMTWWMRMPEGMPRTVEAALAEARRLADAQGDVRAKALLSSGFHDAAGRFVAQLRDTPWCDGAVWSMNSMPGIAGEVTDFGNKWGAALRERLYGPDRAGDLDGEYIDSSEGYVTAELDFRRDHFAAADAPLSFSLDGHRPAIFRGLVVFEYVRAIADDVHGMDKLMMANGTPIRLCWLAPLLDVMGTETDFNRGGRWQPMSDAELLYRRAMCRGKPYCFLMNTRFEDFSHELVERYMKRALAYGMFPGFFSHNASQGHYFTRPELYDRDRPLFQKYVPLCKRVAEAGWQPITRARSSDEHVYVERFGRAYLTLLNDSLQRRTTTIRVEAETPALSRELVTGREVHWQDGQTTWTLGGEDVAVIELGE
ncbi:MAG: hypothetical protein JXB62_06415 [Pirellulales bacterium]|nr:hypothetical protein [Pirellulales bacterium]